jgi:hypothetical protein
VNERQGSLQLTQAVITSHKCPFGSSMSYKREEEFMIDDLRLIIEKPFRKSKIIDHQSSMSAEAGR